MGIGQKLAARGKGSALSSGSLSHLRSLVCVLACIAARRENFGSGGVIMKILNLDLERKGHDTFRIAGSKVIYIDPFQLKSQDKADLVLLSHEHFDHLSREDLEKVCTRETHVVASPLCKDGLKGLHAKATTFLEAGQKVDVDGVEVRAVPAYNTNKFREPGKAFHPQGEPRLGFIIAMDGTRIYHAGDTDFIPEMKSVQCDIALLPVSGTYVMTAEEAAEAAAAIKPRIAIPMHYGAIVGNEADAQRFKSLAKTCQVEIV